MLSSMTASDRSLVSRGSSRTTGGVCEPGVSFLTSSSLMFIIIDGFSVFFTILLREYLSLSFPCPPKVIMSSFAKVRMSYSKLQCPVVMGGHDGRRGQDHNESKRI